MSLELLAAVLTGAGTIVTAAGSVVHQLRIAAPVVPDPDPVTASRLTPWRVRVRAMLRQAVDDVIGYDEAMTS